RYLSSHDLRRLLLVAPEHELIPAVCSQVWDSSQTAAESWRARTTAYHSAPAANASATTRSMAPRRVTFRHLPDTSALLRFRPPAPASSWRQPCRPPTANGGQAPSPRPAS